MTLVLDANVVIKWFLRDEPDEQHAQQVLQILQLMGTGQVRAI